MWSQWQCNGPPEPPPVSTTATVPPPPVSVNNNVAAGPPVQGHGHPSGGHIPQQELSDMLQMIGQPEGNTFEDLSMFNSFQE